MTAESRRDQWAAWLAERRHGGDPDQLRRELEFLAPIRDQVIVNAALMPGHRALDMGCGDGLIAFAATETVRPSEQVIFSDVSTDLLDRCRELAAEADVLDRCLLPPQPIRCLPGTPSTFAASDARTDQLSPGRSVEPARQRLWGEHLLLG